MTAKQLVRHLDRRLRVEPQALALYAAVEVIGAVADVTAGWAERYAAAARWVAAVTRCAP